MGSRYGKKIRERVSAVKASAKKGGACPKCGKKSVKREAYAQWRCNSCGASFAGGAYEPETMVGASVRKTVEALKNVKLGAKA
jgi:large subunit ribosomal protein L37Ae